MHVTELDSFVYKFHQLWKAGLTAHLDVDAHAGKAWVGLRVQLGHVPGPAPHQVYPDVPKTSHHLRRGPAYQRRQERRQAARAAEENSQPTAEVSDVLPADEAKHANKTVQDGLAEKSEEMTESFEQAAVVENEKDNPAEKALEDFPCLICDFSSNWKNGIEIHMARKHSTIEQTDGNISIASKDEFDDDEKYADTCPYWKTGRLGTSFQTFIDANEIIDGSEFQEEFNVKEKAKILEARKCAFGDNYKYVPPWNQR